MIDKKVELKMFEDYIHIIEKSRRDIHVDFNVEKDNPIESNKEEISKLKNGINSDINEKGVYYLLKLSKEDLNEHKGVGLDYLKEAYGELQKNNNSKAYNNAFVICCEIMSNPHMDEDTNKKDIKDENKKEKDNKKIKDVVLEAISLGVPYDTIATQAKLHQIFDTDVETQKTNIYSFKITMNNQIENIKEFNNNLDDFAIKDETKTYLKKISPYIPYPRDKEDLEGVKKDLIQMIDKIYDKGEKENFGNIEEASDNFIMNSKRTTISKKNFKEFKEDVLEVYSGIFHGEKRGV